MVTHGGFLHYFTEDWEDSSQFQGMLHVGCICWESHWQLLGTGWKNTEYRTYTFTEEIHTDDLEGYSLGADNASIEETLESRERRGKTGPMASREEQRNLYKKGTKGWDDQGLAISIAEREAAKVSGGKEVDGVRV